MMPEIKMFQTADAENYAEMIDITSATNKNYCDKYCLGFDSYLGIKRGYFPWHACFNRIVYLKEQIDQGFGGWVFYLDADAYIYGHDFDVRELISGADGDYFFAPGGISGEKWDVNDGVFLINLGSDAGKALAERWYRHFMDTPDAALRQAKDWQMVPSDQPRLHDIFRRNPDLLERLALVPREVFNDERASFVRQVLRSNASTHSERIQKLRSGVAEVLEKEGIKTQPAQAAVSKPILQNPQQYGKAYDLEFRRILRDYASEATSFLEWGAGYTTRMIIEHIGNRGVEKFVTIDNNGEYLDKVVSGYRDLGYLDAKAISLTGPCEDDKDTGLNYSTYPLGLGRQFDFIFIDGRRRMECALMALILAKADSVIVMHDYRRTRYQPVHALYRIIEDGPQFRVMAPRPSIFPLVSDAAQAILAQMNPVAAQAAAEEAARQARGPVQMVFDELNSLSALDALGLAHRYVAQDNLAAATAMAELALANPDDLGEKQVNARVLLASLRERQGSFELAALAIGAAVDLAPHDPAIIADQARITAALERARNRSEPPASG